MNHQYPEGETPTVPPTEQPSFDPPTNWVNYWDHNPIEHGGTFVRWEDGEWHVVEVFPPSGWDGDGHILSEYWFEPQDVWEDPEDPLTGFSEVMERILESLGDSVYPPNGDGSPFLENVTYYVADLHQHTGSQGRSETFTVENTEEYWERVPVDPETVEGVSERDLPA